MTEPSDVLEVAGQWWGGGAGMWGLSVTTRSRDSTNSVFAVRSGSLALLGSLTVRESHLIPAEQKVLFEVR